jgi:hypothetical protein
MKRSIFGAFAVIALFLPVFVTGNDAFATAETQKSGVWYFWTNQGGAGRGITALIRD